MGAPNYYFRNTDNVYAVFLDGELDVEITLLKMQNAFSKYFSSFKKPELEFQEEKHSFDPSYYSGFSIGTIQLSQMFKKISAKIEIEIVLRGGFYEHACLDFTILFQVGNYHEYQLVDKNLFKCVLMDDIPDISLLRDIYKWFEDQQRSLKTNILAIFAQHSTILHGLRPASNGEVLYMKAVSVTNKFKIKPVQM